MSDSDVLEPPWMLWRHPCLRLPNGESRLFDSEWLSPISSSLKIKQFHGKVDK